MQSKEKLEELIRLFKEGKVVEKITAAEDHWKEYKIQKEAYKEKLKEFKKVVDNEFVNCGCYKCKECPYDKCKLKTAIRECYKFIPKEAIQICVICMMADVDDNELFKNYPDLEKALRKWPWANRASRQMSEFLKKHIFSEFEEEDLIEKFFSNPTQAI